MIKTTIKEFLSFLKKPDDLQFDLSVINKIYFLLILLGLNLIISYVFILPLLVKIDEKLLLDQNDIPDLTFLQTILLMVIMIPFLEELFFRYFLRYEGVKTKIISLKRWTKIFPFLVYSSSICFGLVHITNYSNDSDLFFILSPVVVLSQIVGGLTMTFLRVRLNFLWGVFFHSIWNLLATIVLPYISDLFS